jgi:phosphoribosylamine-glycine ligase
VGEGFESRPSRRLPAVQKIHFDGAQFRCDIAAKALQGRGSGTQLA